MANGIVRPDESDIVAFLDGQRLGKTTGTTCPACGRDFNAGDVMLVELDYGREEWHGPIGACTNCKERTFPADGSVDPGFCIVEIGIKETDGRLVFDGDRATVTDRSGATSPVESPE